MEFKISKFNDSKYFSREDGARLKEEIIANWNSEKIIIDCEDIFIAYSGFIDSAFCHLLEKFTIEELQEKLEFVNMHEYDKGMLNKIMRFRMTETWPKGD